jgi:hypothetical protein
MEIRIIEALNTNPLFEPSGDTKDLWMKTRKRPYEIDDKALPGLFSIGGFTQDEFLFGCVCLAEIVGFGLSLWAAKGQNLVLVFILFPIVFLIDYLFAILGIRHKAGEEIVLQNKIVVKEYEHGKALIYEPQNGPLIRAIRTAIVQLHADLIIIKRKKIPGLIALVVSAFAKFITLLIAADVIVLGITKSETPFYEEEPMVIYVAILCFVFVAYGHYRSTGFWANALLFRNQFFEELKVFKEKYDTIAHDIQVYNQGGRGMIRGDYPLSIDYACTRFSNYSRFFSTINFCSVKNGFHRIIITNDGNFQLITKGILLDTESRELAVRYQIAENITEVAVMNLKHQLEQILPAPPQAINVTVAMVNHPPDQRIENILI